MNTRAVVCCALVVLACAWAVNAADACDAMEALCTGLCCPGSNKYNCQYSFTCSSANQQVKHCKFHMSSDTNCTCSIPYPDHTVTCSNPASYLAPSISLLLVGVLSFFVFLGM
eukprot:Phypoly_transcript_30959.p1 GENE.Phypoly_transcript_30959~~Phypoly_transcript_30959.p1  ORF type:complete len:122 (+),score=12.08 Phypoly_transcript_30959:29-367(+)